MEVNIREPRDDKYDGAFQFNLREKGNTLMGKGKAFDTTLQVVNRYYSLEKRDFDYDKEVELPEHLSWEGLYDNITLWPS